MTSFNPDASTPHSPQEWTPRTEMYACVCVEMDMCVGGDPDVIVCPRRSPKVPSTHLKEGRKGFAAISVRPHASPMTFYRANTTSTAKSGPGLQSNWSFKKKNSQSDNL